MPMMAAARFSVDIARPYMLGAETAYMGPPGMHSAATRRALAWRFCDLLQFTTSDGVPLYIYVRDQWYTRSGILDEWLCDCQG